MKIGNIELMNCDNMTYMASVPDKYFDLAIVDPEYGINEGRRNSYHAGASTKYKPKNWDTKVPDDSYFTELFRVSKNQVIWGGNYFALPSMPKWIVWDKQQPEGIDQAMFELAWSSQTNIQSMIFRRSPSADKNCVSNGDKRLRQTRMRIHPTQKPVALYKWILKHYTKEGDKILDTHLGSGSIAIACHDYKFELTGMEIDVDYYNAAVKRLQNHVAQTNLF